MSPLFPQAVPEIPVSNVDDAARYYVDVLGFEMDWGGDDDGKEGGIGGISQGECRMFLTNPAFRGTNGLAAPVTVWLNLHSRQEVDQLYGRWKGRGARIAEDVMDKPWKLREFTILDPDGNRLRVFYDFSRD